MIRHRKWILGIAVMSSAVASAHPHSFIDIKAQPVVENGKLTGLAMDWTMDELTSADLLYDAGDAAPGSEVWKKLAAEVMANVIGQHYFTEFWHGNEKVKFTAVPQRYSLARAGHQAVLSFVLPLAHPQPLSGQHYRISTFDPTYFVDMRYDNATDFRLPAALEAACKVTLTTPQPSEDTLAFAQALDKEDAPPEDMELGKQFAQQVVLQCQ